MAVHDREVRCNEAIPCLLCGCRETSDHCTSYERIQTLDEMRACLADGFPFVFGFTVYESFRVSDSGEERHRPDARAGGAHAPEVTPCWPWAYDDAEKKFWVRNSWGPGWGIHGYFKMPYAYLQNRDLSDDLWTIRRGGKSYNGKNWKVFV